MGIGSVRETDIALALEEAMSTWSDRVALSDGGLRLTFAELDYKSRSVASYLIERGFTAGSLVCVVGRSSLEFACAVVGVIRSGAAFLLVDEDSLTVARMGQLLDLARPGIVLSTIKLEVPGVRAVTVAEATAASGVSITGHLPRQPAFDRTAYAMFTSGSSGSPKCIDIGQASLDLTLQALRDRYRIHADDRLLQVHRVDVDVYLEELLLGLVSGAEVCVVSRQGTEAVGLARRMAELDCTVLNLPTSFAVQMQQQILADGSACRLLVVGGERARLAEFEHAASVTEVRNAYGLTETTITSTVSDPLALDPGSDLDCPIGRPLSGVEVRVLDSNYEPCNAGEPGRIFIGGIGLLKRQVGKQTPDGIVDLGPQYGGSFLNTGDIGSWAEDGQLTFGGRVDRQFKLRGYRVSAEEVEAAVRAALGCHAVVVPRVHAGRVHGVSALVERDPTHPVPDWRGAVGELLPSHLVPDALIQVPVLPRLASGKIDQGACRELAHAGAAQPVAGCSDRRAELSAVVRSIWASVLGALPPEGEMDLLSLGASSLSFLEIAVRLEDASGHAIDALDVFERPNLAEFCSWLGDALDDDEKERLLQDLGDVP